MTSSLGHRPAPAVATAPAPAVARFQGVRVTYGGHHALRDVVVRVPAARLTVVAGPNGAGKSTFLELLAGVRRATSGHVTCEARSVAFVPQRTVVPDRLPVTVREVVTVGAWGEAGPWRRVGAAGRRRVRDSMELLGLEPLARRPFSALSGGERQRTLLAQGLARGAELLLLDEPTTGLDADSAARICEAVDREVRRGVTVVCVSHDPLVVDRADRVVRLEGGRVVAGSGVDGATPVCLHDRVSDDDAPRVVRASREVEAPAALLFDLVADPGQQPRWDGNDNLASAEPGQRVRAVGDVFRTTLTNGGVRENHVVEFEVGRLLAWRPSEVGRRPPGHLWRWEFEALSPGRTSVTHTYDWTLLEDRNRLPRARATTPERLLASLDRLADLAEATAAGR